MSLEGHESHGHTPAAWTLVIIVFVGSAVSGAAVIASQQWLFWVGCAVMVVGVITGKVMQMMGLGAPATVHAQSEALRLENERADAIKDASVRRQGS